MAIRKIIGAIALLSQLSVSGGQASAQSIVAQPLAPLECHINPVSGIGECRAAPQYDAHVQDWLRHTPTWQQMGFKNQADLDRWYDAAERAKATAERRNP